MIRTILHLSAFLTLLILPALSEHVTSAIQPKSTISTEAAHNINALLANPGLDETIYFRTQPQTLAGKKTVLIYK